MTTRLRKILTRIPIFTLSAVATLAVVYLTLMPKPLPDLGIKPFNGIDKLAHSLMMFGLTGALALDCLRLRRYRKVYAAPKVLVIGLTTATILFGGAIELLQGTMAIGRSCDLSDFIADALGSIAAAVVVIKSWAAVVVWYHGTGD